ncbi:MAG: hypothetical protein JWM36_873 [Hyphomicrobiales bacterium]|nr:hypothetical protein [Hyphomicrobiales bacterium]
MGKSALRRISIFGVAGFNRGDDAICQSLIAGFRCERPALAFVVPVLRHGALADVPGVTAFLLDRRSLTGMARLVAHVWRCDAVVLGGGSLIQDQLGGSRVRGILGYAWMVSGLARLLRKPLVTAPIGVDVLTSAPGRQAAREILSRIDRLTVRDALSGQVAAGLVRDAVEVHVACDPVFDFPFPSQGGVEKNIYVLAPAFEGKNEDRIVAIFAEAARLLLARDGSSRVVVVAMDERVEEDGGKIGRIVAALPPALRERVQLVTPASAAEAAAVLRASAGVVAMRLHAMILAYGHAPLHCISRTTKTEALMQSFAIPGCSLHGASSAETIAAQALVGLADADAFEAQKAQAEGLRGVLASYYRDTVDYLEAAIARS